MTDLLRDGGLDEAVCCVETQALRVSLGAPEILFAKRSSALAIAACCRCGGVSAGGQAEKNVVLRGHRERPFVGSIAAWPRAFRQETVDSATPESTSRFRVGQVLPDNQNDGVAQQRVQLPELRSRSSCADRRRGRPAGAPGRPAPSSLSRNRPKVWRRRR